MGLLKKETFVCVDCETTGLDPENDRMIEVAAVKFTFDGTLDEFDTLVDPGSPISKESIEIHHITDDMVQGKPKAGDILAQLLAFIGRHTLVGHGIGFDIDIITNEAKRSGIPCTISNNLVLDTLRMARLYGESPKNSLEQLRHHFNIPNEGAHRAKNDVIVNVEVFKKLATPYTTLKQLVDRLAKPIALKNMPLGKHKGRPFREIPQDYLLWAARQNFDQDLLFSLRSEVNRRKKGKNFSQAVNPFGDL